jgi:predicted metalloprotease with PDZ domain
MTRDHNCRPFLRAAAVLTACSAFACASGGSGPGAGIADAMQLGHVLPASAPVSGIHYDITIDSAAARTQDLGVSMTFQVRGAGPVVLALPAWSPGHYELLWFASHVSHFHATSLGGELSWHKLDYQTWEINPAGAGVVTVSFRYRANARNRAIAWTQRDLAFFNGTNVFLYPVGQGFAWPASVTIHAPADWRVATGMTPGDSANTFVESNYHDLVDMPFVVGRFDFDSVRAGDTWVRLASFPAGGMKAEWRLRTLQWMARLVPTEGAVFHEIPFHVYTVLQLSDTIVNGGGLEHQRSQLDGVTMDGADHAFLPFLHAHELFHAWNVKRLRPADMVPYRYDDAQPTPWLWVSEGVTDYYADVSLARSGIIDSIGFEAALANDIAAVRSVTPVALGDASLSAWIGDVDGTGGIYYPKGAAAGLLLDIMIRHASDNRHSLDDVMRALYDTTYRSRWRGFTSADWWATVSRFAGTGPDAFADFDRRYITGREAMPLDSVLALGGWRLLTDSVSEPRVGVSTAPGDDCSLVTRLVPGGAAADAGVRMGDCVVSVGDVLVPTTNAWDAVRVRYAGTSLAQIGLVVRRAGQTLALVMPVRLVTRTEVHLQEIPDASARAVRVRQGILHGKQTALGPG